MPTLHRVAAFRDDVIFLIVLYQRWLYPVDKTRRNEFGQAGTDEEVAALISSKAARASTRSQFDLCDD
jgi:hypothetical protein